MKVDLVYKNYEIFHEGEDMEDLDLEKNYSLNFNSFIEPSILLADDIAASIKQKQVLNQACLLDLITDPKSITVYEELVRMHKEEGLSFDNVVAIIREDYFPIEKFSIEHKHSFLNDHLFDHVDIAPENIHILNLKDYKLKIKVNGGCDFYFPEKEHYFALNHINSVNTLDSLLGEKGVIRSETHLRIV